MPKAYNNGVLVDVTDADVTETQYTPPATAEQVRAERDELITKTDWWATSDRTMSAAETTYRQALRDIPAQSGFPTNVTWPQEPTS